MISVQDVSFAVDGARILNGVSVDIPNGGITALIGPNGAGKSTLLSLMSRLQKLQVGTIRVDDLEVGVCAHDVLAKRLAILGQSAEVTQRLTVRQLVTFGRYPHHRGRPTEADHAAVAEALAEFDLTTFGERMLDSLSGGQRQRALVAMIFAQDTPYMLLDEPLNNLDIAASRHLMQRLRHLADERGRTIVIVLHDINYAASYADWIIAMKEGRIVRFGAPEDVITSDTIQSVFETDADVKTVEGRRVVVV